LTVTPSASGTVTANPSASGNLYAQGTKVCLTAKAKSGYYFLSWSGATLDAQNCLILTANTSVKATFAKPFALTVSVSPAASGTVTEKPAPTLGTYAPLTKVCLTPTPKAGYAFSSWSGTKLDANNCLAMTANASVTARFVKAYLLTPRVNPASAGTVTAMPASANRYYASGTNVCLTPAPKSGYTFKSWSGATLTANNCLSVKSNVTVTATFARTP
jgi:hypothetical protein